MVFDVSKDRRYLQLENMVVDLETGIKFTLDSAHPAFICEMFKNQFTYSYKHKLIENNELNVIIISFVKQVNRSTHMMQPDRYIMI